MNDGLKDAMGNAKGKIIDITPTDVKVEDIQKPRYLEFLNENVKEIKTEEQLLNLVAEKFEFNNEAINNLRNLTVVEDIEELSLGMLGMNFSIVNRAWKELSSAPKDGYMKIKDHAGVIGNILFIMSAFIRTICKNEEDHKAVMFELENSCQDVIQG